MDKQDVGNKRLFKDAINNFLSLYNKPTLTDQFMQEYAKCVYYRYNLDDIHRALNAIVNKHTKVDANPLPLIVDTLRSLGADKLAAPNALPSSQDKMSKKQLLNAFTQQLTSYAFYGMIDDNFLKKCEDLDFKEKNITAFKEKVYAYLIDSDILKTARDDLGLRQKCAISISNDLDATFTFNRRTVHLCSISAYYLANYIRKNYP